MLNIKCVFRCCLQRLSKIVLILIRVQRDTVINVETSLCKICVILVGRLLSSGMLHRVIGTVTRYGLDGPWIESRWLRGFPHLSRPALGSTQPPIKWVLISFPRVKRPDCGVNHQSPSSSEVKERLEIYLYSTSGFSQTVQG